MHGGRECLETVVQPPAACGAEGADAAALLIQQIEHHDRRTALGGGGQGGIVCDPQVVSQPDDCRVVGGLVGGDHSLHSTRSRLKEAVPER